MTTSVAAVALRSLVGSRRLTAENTTTLRDGQPASDGLLGRARRERDAPGYSTSTTRVTRSTSSIVVTPLATFNEAVVPHRAHPGLLGRFQDLGRGRAAQDELPDRVVHDEHLEDPGPSRVPGVPAVHAADRFVDLDRHVRAERRADFRLRGLDRAGGGGALAVRAEHADEPLRDRGHERGRDQERLDAHVEQAGGDRRRVVGVDRREHEVSGERGVDRDLRGLDVSDLADHDDVGVLPDDRAQGRRKRQAGPRIDRHLVDARDLILDRVLDRDDVVVERSSTARCC